MEVVQNDEHCNTHTLKYIMFVTHIILYMYKYNYGMKDLARPPLTPWFLLPWSNSQPSCP